MHLFKLIKVLRSFDRLQITRLKKYVHSPFFAVYPPSVSLFDYLAPLYPRFAVRKMSVEAIGAHSTSFSSLSQQETASARLMRAIEGFIAYEEWHKDKAKVTHSLLKGFKELSLTAEFEKEYEKEMGQLQSVYEQNPDTFFERHALTELSLTGFNAKLKRTAQNDIMPIVKTLDEFYALKKLRYLCEALNRKQVFGVIYHDQHLPTLLRILEPYTNSEYPYVYLFVNVYRMMAADNFEDCNLYYQLIKQFAFDHGPSPTMREAVTYAINQCLQWNNKGYDEAGNEYLWWIEWKMKHKLLLEKGKLMPITFRNIVTAAFSQKKSENMQKIIAEYSQYLPVEHLDTNLDFANGLYHYSTRHYQKAVRFFLLAQAKDEVIFNSSIRRWQWMCLFECDRNDTEILYSHLSSFEKYLRRNKKELQHVSRVFEIFIAYAMKLLKSTTGEILNRTTNDLQNEDYFPGKTWLLEQLTAKNKKPVRIAHG